MEEIDLGPAIEFVDGLGFDHLLEVRDYGSRDRKIRNIVLYCGDQDRVGSGQVVTRQRHQSGDAARCRRVADRTIQALPYLVAWLQRDAEFPRAALSPIYGRLLTLFALGSARGATIYESSQVLVEALLASGLDQKAYHDLIADIDEIAGDGFGVDMVYWVLGLVESFMNAATPDASARETFLHRILARIVPIYGRLTRLQRIAVTLLSSELGWSLPVTPATEFIRKHRGRSTLPYAQGRGFSSILRAIEDHLSH